MSRSAPITFAVVLLLASGSASFADDVSTAQRVLCAPMVVHECRTEGDCVRGAPWEFDMAPFVDIDFETGRIASSDGQRASDLKNVEREGELIIVYAYENGRALSALISGPSGFFSATFTLDDGSITVFGACKPYNGEEP